MISIQGLPAVRITYGPRPPRSPGRSRQAVEADTYNHLFTFFNRYYRDGEYDYVAEIVKV